MEQLGAIKSIFFGFVLGFIFLISSCENNFYDSKSFTNTEIETQQEISLKQKLNS